MTSSLVSIPSSRHPLVDRFVDAPRRWPAAACSRGGRPPAQPAGAPPPTGVQTITLAADADRAGVGVHRDDAVAAIDDDSAGSRGRRHAHLREVRRPRARRRAARADQPGQAAGRGAQRRGQPRRHRGRRHSTGAQQVKRLESLVEAGAISRQEFEQAQNSAAHRRGAPRGARRAGARRARRARSTTASIAPQAGMVGDIPVRVGRSRHDLDGDHDDRRRTRRSRPTSRCRSTASPDLRVGPAGAAARRRRQGASPPIRSRSSRRAWTTRRRPCSSRARCATCRRRCASSSSSARASSGARAPGLTVPVTAVVAHQRPVLLLRRRAGRQGAGRAAEADRGRRGASATTTSCKSGLKAGDRLIVSRHPEDRRRRAGARPGVAMFVDTFIRRPILASVCSLVLILAGARRHPDDAGRAVPGAGAAAGQRDRDLHRRQRAGSRDGRHDAARAGDQRRRGHALHDLVEHEQRRRRRSPSPSTSRAIRTSPRSTCRTASTRRSAACRPKCARPASPSRSSRPASSWRSACYSEKGAYDSLFLSNYLDVYVKDALKRVPGVGDVIIFGERKYSMRLWLDPDRLAARGLTAGDVVQALREQNVQVAAGSLGQAPAPVGPDVPAQRARASAGCARPSEFDNIILKSGRDGSLVRLKDVGRAELGAETYARRPALPGRRGGRLRRHPAADRQRARRRTTRSRRSWIGSRRSSRRG